MTLTEALEESRVKARTALLKFERRRTADGSEFVYVAREADFDALRLAVTDILERSAE